jgi:prophage antirepressor-like protein
MNTQIYQNIKTAEEEKIDNAAREFNPFRIFDRVVARKFLIRPREYEKYTAAQLDELVSHKLRVFVFDGQTWFLAKDVCSFLGINPKKVQESLKKIELNCVRKETVTTTWAPCWGAQVQQGRLVSLINEPGIYALIQKSRTVYAQDFKEWLNEKVLPTIRATGQYQLSQAAPEMEEERKVIEEAHEFEEHAAGLMSNEEKDEVLDRILREKDQIISEMEHTISEQKDEIQRKDSSHKNLMEFLVDMREENRRSQQESKQNMENLTHRVENLQTENRQINDNVRKLQSKMDIVIKDRVAKPVDVGKVSFFVIYDTHEDDLENDRYPYCVVKCQKQYLKTNEKRIKDKYPQGTKLFQLENPSADSLYQVVKEKVKERGLKVHFRNTSFYLTTNDYTIQNFIDVVKEIDRERTNVD